MRTPARRAYSLADAVLRAAGSGMRHYSVHSTRERILGEAEKAIGLQDRLADSLQEFLASEPFVDLSSQDGPACECGDFVDYVPQGDEAPTCRHVRARALLAEVQS